MDWLCQSMKINKKHVQRQSQVRKLKPINSEVKWIDCSLIIIMGCWVHIFYLILDSSVGLWMGIPSAGDSVSQTSQLRILHSSEEKYVSLWFENRLPVLQQENWQQQTIHRAYENIPATQKYPKYAQKIKDSSPVGSSICTHSTTLVKPLSLIYFPSLAITCCRIVESAHDKQYYDKINTRWFPDPCPVNFTYVAPVGCYSDWYDDWTQVEALAICEGLDTRLLSLDRLSEFHAVTQWFSRCKSKPTETTTNNSMLWSLSSLQKKHGNVCI